MTKYQPLVDYFASLPGEAWQATFEDIERILGFRLPPSARAHQAWWANSDDLMPQKAAWAGWRTRELNLAAGHVLFVRESGGSRQRSRPPGNAVSISPPPSLASAPHDWDTASEANVRVSLAWVPLGRIVVDAGGKLAFPAASALPALYRFRVKHGETQKRYIGQTQNLSRRFGFYRNPGPSQQTNVRLNAEFLRALGAGAEIAVAAVTDGAWVDHGAGPVAAEMASAAVRCLLENAAILAERATGVESLNRSEVA